MQRATLMLINSAYGFVAFSDRFAAATSAPFYPVPTVTPTCTGIAQQAKQSKSQNCLWITRSCSMHGIAPHHSFPRTARSSSSTPPTRTQSETSAYSAAAEQTASLRQSDMVDSIVPSSSSRAKNCCANIRLIPTANSRTGRARAVRSEMRGTDMYFLGFTAVPFLIRMNRDAYV